MNKINFIDAIHMMVAAYLLHEAVYNLELPREAVIVFSVIGGFFLGVQITLHLEWIIWVVKRMFGKD